MDFMVPLGIRLGLADGTLCLPDKIRIQLPGRRPLCGEHVSEVRRPLSILARSEVRASLTVLRTLPRPQYLFQRNGI
ncbi:hypothetical protein F444_20540 [Phytophthora nicotianae P1976]|uniref:Uncharacterized protein n=1 Tax=Phytophthora nicotianae P1976 TaxID=1317066 RepID=A0A080Z491_PHYNI|nr:hypothetical protein F444_20540 [Phytophthora nicotianae P1976]